MRTTSLNNTTTATRAASPLATAPLQRSGRLTDQQKAQVVQRASDWLGADGGVHISARVSVFQALIKAVGAGENAVVVDVKPHDLPEFEGFTVIEGGDAEYSQIQLSHQQGKLQQIGREIAELEAMHSAAKENAKQVLEQHNTTNAGRRSDERSPLNLTALDKDTQHLIRLHQEHAQIVASMRKHQEFLTIHESLRQSRLL